MNTRLTFKRMKPIFQKRSCQTFIFTNENFRNPKIPHGSKIQEVSVIKATDETLEGYGFTFTDPAEVTVEKGNFEIKKWPVSGWRKLDPGTGDEAGTIEGNFDVFWKGDYFYGHNLAINTTNNFYLDGLGRIPEEASLENEDPSESIYLWMSDYHPDGGQMFFPENEIDFVVCLGKNTVGDDVFPGHMQAFHVEKGKGVYFHPGTWHNGVYTNPRLGKQRFLTRQGRVHGRISCNWTAEFQTLLKLNFPDC